MTSKRGKLYLQAGVVLAVLVLGLWSRLPAMPARGQEPAPDEAEAVQVHSVTGLVLDSQEQPVVEAEVVVFADWEEEPIAETHTQEDGHFVALMHHHGSQSQLRSSFEIETSTRRTLSGAAWQARYNTTCHAIIKVV